MEVWALNQLHLLKQQNESIEKQISEMEKLLRGGALRPLAPAATASPAPATTSATATPASARREDYRQEYRQEYVPESRPDPRLEQRLEPREETRLEHRLEYRPERTYDPRPAPLREPSPAAPPVVRGYATPPPAPSYDEREHRPSASHGKPPYGQKEYDYGEAQRGEYRAPQDSYGKAPSYKTYTKPYKPYDKPYEKRPAYEVNGRERGVSPPSSRYASSAGGRPMDRRGSYEGRAQKRPDSAYRY